MSYVVRCKKPGSLFWKTFKNVKGDGIIWFEDRGRDQQAIQARYLILEDGRRIEIPFTIIIEFSKEREDIIRENIAVTVEGKKKR